jgi:GDP-L-fucose synthase
MEAESRIFIAGHRGMVGSAVHRRLTQEGYGRIITRSHSELDLGRQADVESFFAQTRPEYVFLAAARVGGIWANSAFPAEFIYENLIMQTNVIHAAWKTGVKRLLFLGSSCIYPKACPQPMKEEYLLTAPLEPTNEPYAVAKIAGVKMCEAYNRQYGSRFLSVMPTNLYGPNDTFDLEISHVLPALIRKFHLAKMAGKGDWEGIERDEIRFGSIPEKDAAGLRASPPKVVLWGSGSPLREFLHVDDAADACVFLMNLPEDSYVSCLRINDTGPLINIGFGRDITIKELAETIKDIVGFQGETAFDSTKPDGTPRKLLDISRLGLLGWSPSISLRQGIEWTYAWYLKQEMGMRA